MSATDSVRKLITFSPTILAVLVFALYVSRIGEMYLWAAAIIVGFLLAVQGSIIYLPRAARWAGEKIAEHSSQEGV